MSRFLNITFPFEEVEFESKGNHDFTYCQFTEGYTVILTSSLLLFDSCHFKSGSIVTFTDPIYLIRFTNCVFEPGAMIHLGKNCWDLTIDKCSFPPDTSVFSGVTHAFYYTRVSPVESISFLPKCEHLYLCDGKGGDDVGWEILEPISLPQGTIVTYYNDAILSGPRSMDILISMFWRNPRFKISGLLWSGNEQDGNEFRKLGEYYNRRRRIRLVVSCVLTFLNAKILPGDLVRGELVPFLTQ